MRTIWVLGVVILCLTSPSLARKKLKKSHVSATVKRPYFGAQHPYYGAELVNPYYRAQLSNPYLSPALPNPYFGADVPQLYYSAQNLAPAISTNKYERKIENSQLLHPKYGAGLNSYPYFRADLPYYNTQNAITVVGKKDKKSKRHAKQVVYPVLGGASPYFNAEIHQPYYSTQPFYAASPNPITNKKSSKKSKRKTKVVYPNYGLQAPYYRGELPKLPLFKSELQFPKLKTQIPAIFLNNNERRYAPKYASEITKPYLRSQIQNPFLNAKFRRPIPNYRAEPYYAANPYSRTGLNQLYRRSPPQSPRAAAQIIYTGGDGIFDPGFPFSPTGGFTIIRS